MNLPSAFTEQTKALLGAEEYDKLAASLEEDSPVSIRFNNRKIADDSFFTGLLSSFPPVPWSSSGYYLDERLTFTFDPLFHAGSYYVQEASSMFVEQVLRSYIHEPAVMLDLCAAPGGKSTHARSVLPEGSLLVANEVIRPRSQILAENLVKWGHPDMVVTNNDPSDFSSLPAFFDVILTDVPCSGEGMFRKDAGAIGEWSPDNVNICRQRQRRIVADVWDSLKPGGILIYSTCTYNTQENEENVEWIMIEYGAEALSVAVPPEWGITGNLLKKEFPVYRFLPYKTKGEGFFLAALRKPSGDDAPGGKVKQEYTERRKKKNNQLKTPSIPGDVREWLLDAANYNFELKDTLITAFPKKYELVYPALQQLKIVHAGILVGELKGKDVIPHHSLAMSFELNRTKFPGCELTYEQAIAYLRKEAIVLGPDVTRGYVVVMYRGIPLGFVKNIGNRANNLYPNEWRIRSGYLPEEIRVLELPFKSDQ